VVRSIARRTGETSKTVEDHAMHLDGRINALARTQALVTRDPVAGVGLEHLVAEELLAHAAREGEQVTISGPPVRLQAKAAENFGLAVHELATNAVKYGALSAKSGRIAVAWDVERTNGAARLTFEWTETGVPLDRTQPRRRGFGTELLERTLAYELGAEARAAFEPDGVRWRIELPLDEKVAVLGPG
jgi:two-component system, chemotaxis family, CheB/CheR fusion protein